MDYLITIMVFCLILFLYLHVFHHLKTSDDLEVYTLKSPSKDKLEEICTIRQPVLFQYSNNDIFQQFTLPSLKKNQGVFDVSVRKVGDDLYLPILLKEALVIIPFFPQYLAQSSLHFFHASVNICSNR